MIILLSVSLRMLKTTYNTISETRLTWICMIRLRKHQSPTGTE